MLDFSSFLSSFHTLYIKEILKHWETLMIVLITICLNLDISLPLPSISLSLDHFVWALQIQISFESKNGVSRIWLSYNKRFCKWIKAWSYIWSSKQIQIFYCSQRMPVKNMIIIFENIFVGLSLRNPLEQYNFTRICY